MEYNYTGVQMMRSLSDCGSSATYAAEADMVVRKGPWTEDEDSVLINYVTVHGEGQWNSVARCTRLKRTGKSCRLRWLNYLRPNVRRGNITLQEQLMILDLHSRWGNRWSKIAQHLPGRTDNEIKNYWRTRVVKQAKQLKCDVNSKQFRDALRFVWMPRLLERIRASSQSGSAHDQSIFSDTCHEAQSDPCGANPSFVSAGSSHTVADVRAPSLSDSSVSYNLMGGDSWSHSAEQGSSSWQQGEHRDIQAIETVNGFGGAEFWTEENICFLQQQLADDL